MKRSVKRTLGLAALNLFFISICLIGLVPILYAFLLSVSSGSGALTTGLSILPENTHWTITGLFLWKSLF